MSKQQQCTRNEGLFAGSKLPAMLCVLFAVHCPSATAAETDTRDSARSAIGQLLFFDRNLSLLRNQSCSSCHDPASGYADARDNGVAGAASLGGDGRSLGDRNAPGTAYVASGPEFRQLADGEYVGGFFLDGRAASLQEQAMEPFLNPAEMAMPDAAAVVSRIRDDPRYKPLFESAFGAGIFDDPSATYSAVAASLAAYENTATFQPFDSRYDRFLRGEYELTAAEELGRRLFFSQLVNCHQCHLQDAREFTAGEPFTNYRYHNIGVPVNAALRALNGSPVAYRDPGLYGNPRVTDPQQAGKFRVPSLRNVAVTGPYMHNGVFRQLDTAILFYNRFTLVNDESQVNPETGRPWGNPETAETVDFERLQDGQPLSEDGAAAIAAFLRALTDKRYEHLLQPPAETSGRVSSLSAE